MLLSLLTFIQSAHADTATAAPANDPLSIFTTFIMPIAMIAIFYFVFFRPQMRSNKERRAMIEALTEGSEVVFASGLMGRIKKLQGDYAVIDLGSNQSVKVQRASIITVLPAGTLAGLN